MAKARPLIGLDAQAPTGANARIIAKARLDEVYEWNKYVDNPYHIHELHNLRIATKRLRYTLEIFAEVLPVTCQPIIQELTHIQEELGALHDSDVMIALLRLYLGSQDSGTAYESALVDVKQQHHPQFTLPPELVADLLEPTVAPSAEERYGLEQLLLNQQQNREQQYTTFRQHWYQLQARDFRREILNILDTAGT